jgi:putative transposase
MPNHVHFLLRIKDLDVVEDHIKSIRKVRKGVTIDKLLSREFGNFFNSYTKSYNKLFGRMGSLFIPTFKRKLVDNRKYFYDLVKYIHFNPVESGLAGHPKQWKYSSYDAILSGRDSFVSRKELIEWYGDVDNFKFVHEHRADPDGLSE